MPARRNTRRATRRTPASAQVTVAHKLPRGVDWAVAGLTGSGGQLAVVGLDPSLEKAFAKRFKLSATELAADLGASARTAKLTALPAVDGVRVLAIGLGADEPTPDLLRRLAAEAVRAIADRVSDSGHTSDSEGNTGSERGAKRGTDAAIPGPVRVAIGFGSDEPELLQATAEGVLLGSYRYVQPGRDDARLTWQLTVLTAAADAGSAEIAEQAQQRTDAVLAAREWVNLPPNLLYPQTFAEAAQDYLADTDVEVEVLDETELAALGYGGLLAVGGGSQRPPRLVRMSYQPRGASSHLALVGKGITFDSGGLSLKPGDSMLTMKSDMAGAAAVIAAVGAIARLNIGTKVTAYAAMAENMPSATAFRPSDVLSIYGGKTVENMNSDAEGRLVMADALARSEADDADLVVDVATLTGAIVVALGDRTSGLFTSDDETAEQVLTAAETAGELLWRMPLLPEVDEELRSKVADVRSTHASRNAGASAAASFLHRFVDPTRHWAHLDIAGKAFREGPAYGYVGPGGTGVMVRTLVELAAQMSRN